MTNPLDTFIRNSVADPVRVTTDPSTSLAALKINPLSRSAVLTAQDQLSAPARRGVNLPPQATVTVTASAATPPETLAPVPVIQGPQGTRGDPGPPGEQGPAPEITIGSVTVGPTAQVTVTGTAPQYTLNFRLPQAPGGVGDVSTTDSYADPPWITALSKSKVGLGNVEDLSKAQLFTDPTFTGTVTGISAADVGLGNVNNESKATMFTDPQFTGVTAVTVISTGVRTKTVAQATEIYDCSLSSIWYHTSMNGDWTADLVNLPVTESRSLTVTFVLPQGVPARRPTALAIAGVNQLVNWPGGSQPSGNQNKIDVITYQLIRTAGSWIVLADLKAFG